MLRPKRLDRALWPLYPVEHSYRSAARLHSNLPIPGLPQQENPTSWNPWTGRVDANPPSLQPAYGGILDTVPNVRFGGGPGAGAGVLPSSGITAILLALDPASQGEALPGVAPKLAFSPNTSMDFRTPPTLGDIALKIPAGP